MARCSVTCIFYTLGLVALVQRCSILLISLLKMLQFSVLGECNENYHFIYEQKLTSAAKFRSLTYESTIAKDLRAVAGGIEL